MISVGQVRPTYYVYQMYQHFGSQLVYSASGQEGVSIYAAKREDGSLTILVVNLLDAEQSLSLEIKGSKLGAAETWRFDAEHLAENLGEQDLSIGTLTLPAQSINLYVIRE